MRDAPESSLKASRTLSRTGDEPSASGNICSRQTGAHLWGHHLNSQKSEWLCIAICRSQLDGLPPTNRSTKKPRMCAAFLFTTNLRPADDLACHGNPVTA